MKTELLDKLFAMQDIEYRKFHTKLMPTIDKEKVIGVRIPDVRKIAKEVDDIRAEAFMSRLPHTYYEENNLHAFLIDKIKNFDKCIEEVDRFLPYIDNWATCDSLRPKCFYGNKNKLILKIYEWLNFDREYTVRFAIEMLMVHFLDDDFDKKYMEKVAKIKSDKYYINMMIAWYFATALAKQYEWAVEYIEKRKLSPWVHNKTIQKAVESYRVTDERKEYLKKQKWSV